MTRRLALFQLLGYRQRQLAQEFYDAQNALAQAHNKWMVQFDLAIRNGIVPSNVQRERKKLEEKWNKLWRSIEAWVSGR